MATHPSGCMKTSLFSGCTVVPTKSRAPGWPALPLAYRQHCLLVVLLLISRFGRTRPSLLWPPHSDLSDGQRPQTTRIRVYLDQVL